MCRVVDIAYIQSYRCSTSVQQEVPERENSILVKNNKAELSVKWRNKSTAVESKKEKREMSLSSDEQHYPNGPPSQLLDHSHGNTVCLCLALTTHE